MKRKTLLLIIAAVALLTAATVSAILIFHQNSINTQLYYLSLGADELVAKEKNIRYAKTEEIPLDVIDALKNKSGLYLKSPVSQNAKVNTVAYEGGGKVKIDLSGEFLSDSESPVLSTYAVIKSIYDASKYYGIKSIKITCAGEDIKAKDGREIGYLSGDEIGNEGDIMNFSTECVLYYLDKKTSQLRGEKRIIYSTSGSGIEKNIISALSDGPVSEELKKTIKGDISLISSETVDGTCFVNLKTADNITSDGVYSIAKSLISAGKIDNVKFLVNGKNVDKIGGVDVRNPIE